MTIREEQVSLGISQEAKTMSEFWGLTTGRERCFGLETAASRTIALERQRHCLDHFWLNNT
jgi:hypothetical protein